MELSEILLRMMAVVQYHADTNKFENIFPTNSRRGRCLCQWLPGALPPGSVNCSSCNAASRRKHCSPYSTRGGHSWPAKWDCRRACSWVLEKTHPWLSKPKADPKKPKDKTLAKPESKDDPMEARPVVMLGWDSVIEVNTSVIEVNTQSPLCAVLWPHSSGRLRPRTSVCPWKRICSRSLAWKTASCLSTWCGSRKESLEKLYAFECTCDYVIDDSWQVIKECTDWGSCTYAYAAQTPKQDHQQFFEKGNVVVVQHLADAVDLILDRLDNSWTAA